MPVLRTGDVVGQGDAPRWQVGRKIGEGQFSEVYQVQDMQTREQVGCRRWAGSGGQQAETAGGQSTGGRQGSRLHAAATLWNDSRLQQGVCAALKQELHRLPLPAAFCPSPCRSLSLPPPPLLLLPAARPQDREEA